MTVWVSVQQMLYVLKDDSNFQCFIIIIIPLLSPIASYLHSLRPYYLRFIISTITIDWVEFDIT